MTEKPPENIIKIMPIFSNVNLEDQEKIIWQGRPAWASLWVMALGVMVGICIPIWGRHQEGPPALWLFMSAVFALIALSRRRQFYLLTNKRFVKANGWGISRFYELNLKNLRGFYFRQGLSSRLSGTGHIFLNSWQPTEAGLDVYGQPNPDKLMDLIAKTALAAGAELEKME